MKTRYVYSINGEDYAGSFDSRQAAEAAAITAARNSSIAPATVFVARAVMADPAASGHAQSVLADMVARARHDGAAAGGRYLANLTSHQINDLDLALESAVLSWLDKHHLTPACFHVEAISEHTVPAGSVTQPAAENHVFAAVSDEVYDLGID